MAAPERIYRRASKSSEVRQRGTNILSTVERATRNALKGAARINKLL